MKTAIIKYNAGNIQSVKFGLQRIGVENPVITDDHELIRSADRVIFPGVGEASTVMHYLRERKMDTLIKSLLQPVLGICLGMQLMCRRSGEGDTACLSIFEQEIKRFDLDLKVPHMGWNRVSNPQGPLFRGIDPESWFYFVHSFYAPVGTETSSRCDYGIAFSSSIQKDNFFGCQFHPEKSGRSGEQLLKNFITGEL